MSRNVGDPTTLTRLWWDCPEPAGGDLLRTRSGRTYLILEVRGRRLDCVVVPPDTETTGDVFEWEWAKRGRRRPKIPWTRT